ncbi:hypothetical protein M408DRAFT_333646 [Serendipita vermifera MAFF 305830]|uniref:Uncharacterized protein n=1 Tax=Serendipita vermifera MAFF 305830 TaxID=933852 RepID=A0A0C3APJ4_SERVB|nr:hypothetical protein M408DRAFT_333646 [Serendipita vermifera MAFF 305830]
MDTMTRRMDLGEDYGRGAGQQAVVISSTSGEGEGDTGIGVYSFTGRRKNRRKTITLNDPRSLGIGSQSLSESAFNTPSPSPFNASLPPSQLRLQTTFNPVDYSTVVPTNSGSTSPKRTSGRTTTSSSPTKKQAGVVLGDASNTSVIGGNQLKEMERGRGRGIPRTLTLPAHLTESLMMMKLTREREGSTDIMGAYTETEGQKSADKDGMDLDGMELDQTEPRKPALKVIVGSQEAGGKSPERGNASSPRKSKRRRARSLPPRPVSANEEEECDADDEGGDAKQGEDGADAGLFSPVTPRRRGRGEPMGVGVGVGASDVPMDSMPLQPMPGGMVPIPSGVLRRSARRVKPEIGAATAFGGPNPFLQNIAEAEAGSGMEGVDVIRHSPRKRARTREGGERDRDRGRDEEGGRATKRTRKR